MSSFILWDLGFVAQLKNFNTELTFENGFFFIIEKFSQSEQLFLTPLPRSGHARVELFFCSGSEPKKFIINDNLYLSWTLGKSSDLTFGRVDLWDFDLFPFVIVHAHCSNYSFVKRFSLFSCCNKIPAKKVCPVLPYSNVKSLNEGETSRSEHCLTVFSISLFFRLVWTRISQY